MIMKNTMKTLLFNMLACVLLPVTALGQTYTNGVYVQNGKTFEVDKRVCQFTPTNSSEVLYFSNELIAKVYTNGNFMVNGFYQEVLNKKSTPEKAKFGVHNFAASVLNGTTLVAYSGGDSNSSCTVSTPMTDVELSKGIFYFEVTEKKVIVAVLEGSMKYYIGKKENLLTIGQAVIAEPSDVGILENKISVSPGKVNTDAMKKLTASSKEITNLKGTILFSRIDGKLIGILID
jgi:hypothetical protein